MSRTTRIVSTGESVEEEDNRQFGGYSSLDAALRQGFVPDQFVESIVEVPAEIIDTFTSSVRTMLQDPTVPFVVPEGANVVQTPEGFLKLVGPRGLEFVLPMGVRVAGVDGREWDTPDAEGFVAPEIPPEHKAMTEATGRDLVDTMKKVLEVNKPSRNWYSKRHTYTDTKEYTEEFMDYSTGTKFYSRGVIIRAPSANSGNINIRFARNAEWTILEPGITKAFDGLSTNKFWVKLDTADLNVDVDAW